MGVAGCVLPGAVAGGRFVFSSVFVVLLVLLFFIVIVFRTILIVNDENVDASAYLLPSPLPSACRELYSIWRGAASVSWGESG